LFITAFYCLRQKFINWWSLLITASQYSTISEKGVNLDSTSIYCPMVSLCVQVMAVQCSAQRFDILWVSWQYNIFLKGFAWVYVLTVQYSPQSFKIVSESWQYNLMQNGSTLGVCRDSIIKCTTYLHRVWVGTIQHSTQRFHIVCGSRDSTIFCTTVWTHE
jgi:phosphoserine aminotransferase